MPRTRPPWVGKTDDDKIPPRVRLRVFEAAGGRCYCCGTKIRPGIKWDLDHAIPLFLGGSHAEWNLRPILAAHHKLKNSKEAVIKSKSYRVRTRHLGIKRRKSRPMPGSKGSGFRKRMDGTVIREKQ